MKIKTTYIACDDTEFDSMKECRRYETTLYDYFYTIAQDCEFINSKGQQIAFAINENDWEGTCEEFDYMYCIAQKIIVKKNLSQCLIYYINTTLDYELPQDKGTYIYNDDARQPWKKVD